MHYLMDDLYFYTIVNVVHIPRTLLNTFVFYLPEQIIKRVVRIRVYLLMNASNILGTFDIALTLFRCQRSNILGQTLSDCCRELEAYRSKQRMVRCGSEALIWYINY